MPYTRFSAAEQAEVWDRWERGDAMNVIARGIGRSQGAVHEMIKKTGGVRPLAPTVWSERRLSLADREEISRGLAAGESLRTIADSMDRAPSTISREVRANGGRRRYRACDAEIAARLRARRPKTPKLAQGTRLCRVVEAKLNKRWSPQQIARQMLGRYGWSSGQFSCLNPLWAHESGWSVTARNSGSGAYGIPQALPGSQLASAGSDWQSNAATQIKWGLTYIQGRYGSPCGAWAHEQANGWY